jgi:hypothetical protein
VLFMSLAARSGVTLVCKAFESITHLSRGVSACLRLRSYVVRSAKDECHVGLGGILTRAFIHHQNRRLRKSESVIDTPRLKSLTRISMFIVLFNEDSALIKSHQQVCVIMFDRPQKLQTFNGLLDPHPFRIVRKDVGNRLRQHEWSQ